MKKIILFFLINFSSEVKSIIFGKTKDERLLACMFMHKLLYVSGIGPNAIDFAFFNFDNNMEYEPIFEPISRKTSPSSNMLRRKLISTKSPNPK